MESGILNPGFWNSEYSSGNPGPNKRLKSRVQDLLKNTGIQYLEYGIQSVESRNPRLSLRRTGYGLTLVLKAFFVIKSGKNDKLGENVAVGSIFLCFNAGYLSSKILNSQLGHMHLTFITFIIACGNVFCALCVGFNKKLG